MNNKFLNIILILISLLIIVTTSFTIKNTKEINIINNNDSNKNNYIDNKLSNNFYIEEAKLIRVVDGDTLVVSINGENKKLRMLEINCPESVSSNVKMNTEEGELAHHFTEKLLENIDKLYLTKDKSETDQYGRLLRLVWLSKPNDIFDEYELREKCVNAILLLEGHAKVVEYDDNSYIKIFKKFEKESKNNK